MAVQFYERHADCREAKLAQAHAISSMSQSLHDVAAVLGEFLDLAQRDSEQ